MMKFKLRAHEMRALVHARADILTFFFSFVKSMLCCRISDLRSLKINYIKSILNLIKPKTSFTHLQVPDYN